MIKGATAIFKKEARTTFLSFSTFFVFSLFALASGFFFFADLLDWNRISRQAAGQVLSQLDFIQVVIGPFFMNVCLALLLIIPVFTMKTFSEERKLGTFELLFTYPVSDFQIVLGKWMALALTLFLLLLPSLGYFSLLYFLKSTIPISVVLIAFLGLFLMALAFASLGMFLSSLTENQLVSAVFSFVIIFLFWTLGWITDWILPGISRFLGEFWLVRHMREFASGILDTTRIAFYVIGILFFFFATILSLESRSWKR